MAYLLDNTGCKEIVKAFAPLILFGKDFVERHVEDNVTSSDGGRRIQEHIDRLRGSFKK